MRTEPINRFSALLYGSILDQSKVNDLLVELDQHISSVNVGLSWINHTTGLSTYSGSKAPEDLVRLWMESYEHEPWSKAGKQKGIAGSRPESSLSEEVLANRSLRGTWFYNDIYRIADVEHCANCAWLTPAFEVVLVANRSAKQAQFDECDKKLFEALEPHIENYAKLLWEREALEQRENLNSLTATLRRENILDAEPDFATRIEQSSGARIRNRRIELKSSAQHLQFQKAISQIYEGSGGGSWINRSFQIDPELFLHIEPFEITTSNFSRDRLIKVRLFKSEIHRTHATQVLELLTRAERDLCMALSQGNSLTEYAEVNSKSIHTVRTQMKTIFRKTGIRSQRELLVELQKTSSK